VFKGNHAFPTAGIIINKATCIIKETNIEGFTKGGIMMWLEDEHVVKVFTTKVKNCKHVGIQVMGSSGSPLIEYCNIEDNQGTGILVCTGNSCQIRKNEIHNNHDGVEIVSGDAILFKNNISKNNSNGVVTRAVEDLVCAAKITLNEITSNRGHGIYCVGYNNMTKIIENKSISYNKLAGIKIDLEASCLIIKNHVFKNIHQGILVAEKSNAHIEKNEISENIKANLAFGGEGSTNNSVMRNKIFGGRCEGIFIIEGGLSLVYKNDIFENYDGIICCTA
jgi:F-box protein 11